VAEPVAVEMVEPEAEEAVEQDSVEAVEPVARRGRCVGGGASSRSGERRLEPEVAGRRLQSAG
jgi:hypothetical protein